MRRSVIAARSSAGSLARAAVYQKHFQPRRMFASGTPPPSKSEPPTTPVDRSQDQAHPIGAYYEGVLNGSKNYPDTKPELPPVTSQRYPTKLAPAEPEAKPEPEKEKQAEPEPKPKQDDNVSPAPTPSEPPNKEEQQQPVKQAQKEEEKKPAIATTSAAPADEPELELAKKTDEKGDEAIIAIPATPAPVPAKRAVVLRTLRELKKKKDPKEAKEPKVVKSAQATSSQSAEDPTPSSNPSGNLSGSDGSGAVPASSSSPQVFEGGEAGDTRIIFSASLASAAQRAERLASIRSQSKLVAGVLVPPRPEEPDNCCMSGCVNCVWDQYRDEMEAWATATAEAEQRLAAQEAGLGEAGAVAVTGAVEAAGGSQQSPSTSTTSTSTAAAGDGQEQQTTAVKGTELAGTAHSVVDHRGAVSMDDDGAGSSSNWDFGTAQNPATGAAGATKTSTSTSTSALDDNLFKNVPVGIREFMKQEKRLKEKHAREGTVG
ncbi:hypothetical protein N0V85_000838 [Neurospora sp. IMI 360204]|nr:hypothetical protein N0V85_000838 [Neurospora sp. IMI 360204]